MTKLLLIPGVLVALAGWWLYQDMQQQLNMPLKIDVSEYFSIEPGMSLLDVAEGLAQRNWFNYPIYLQLEGKLQGVDGLIKAGQYQVEPGHNRLVIAGDDSSRQGNSTHADDTGGMDVHTDHDGSTRKPVYQKGIDVNTTQTRYDRNRLSGLLRRRTFFS